MITIIILLILAVVSVNAIVGKNGVITQAQGASAETAKAKFLEDAEMAYSDAYTDKTQTEGPDAKVTVYDVVNKLKDEYGYNKQQGQNNSITTVMSNTGGLGIQASEQNITVAVGKEKSVTIIPTEGTTTSYVNLNGAYYPVSYNEEKEEVELGDSVKKLPSGTTNVSLSVNPSSNTYMEAVVNGLTITVKGKSRGSTAITANYGGGSTNETTGININVTDMFTVTLSTNDATMGTVSPDGSHSYEEGSVVNLVATPTSGTYAFAGWYKDGTALISSNYTYPYTVTGDASIQGKFERNTSVHALTIRSSDTNMGTVTNAKTGVATGERANITSTATARNGYKLVGWYLNGSQVTTSNTYNGVMPSSDTTLEARFEAVNYTITYDDNGGTLDTGNKQTRYTIKTETFMLPTMKREGCTFTGWTGSNGTTPQISVTIPVGSTGDKTYRANYSEIEPTGVTLNQTSIELRQGAIYGLTATVQPTNAYNKNVTWSSSNDNIARVQGGVVTGVSAGTAQITATTNKGNKSATCTVDVL